MTTWRKEPPTMAEVKACAWWWVRDERRHDRVEPSRFRFDDHYQRVEVECGEEWCTPRDAFANVEGCEFAPCLPPSATAPTGEVRFVATVTNVDMDDNSVDLDYDGHELVSGLEATPAWPGAFVGQRVEILVRPIPGAKGGADAIMRAQRREIGRLHDAVVEERAAHAETKRLARACDKINAGAMRKLHERIAGCEAAERARILAILQERMRVHLAAGREKFGLYRDGRSDECEQIMEAIEPGCTPVPHSPFVAPECAGGAGIGKGVQPEPHDPGVAEVLAAIDLVDETWGRLRANFAMPAHLFTDDVQAAIKDLLSIRATVERMANDLERLRERKPLATVEGTVGFSLVRLPPIRATWQGATEGDQLTIEIYKAGE